MIVGSFSLIFIPKCRTWDITFHLFVVLRITYFFLPLPLCWYFLLHFIMRKHPWPSSHFCTGILDLAMLSKDKKSKIWAWTFEQARETPGLKGITLLMVHRQKLHHMQPLFIPLLMPQLHKEGGRLIYPNTFYTLTISVRISLFL